MTDFTVRTEYDGKDLIKVLELYYYDADGEEVVDSRATDACLGCNTCSDMGAEQYDALREQIARQLRRAGIDFGRIEFEDQDD